MVFMAGQPLQSTPETSSNKTILRATRLNSSLTLPPATIVTSRASLGRNPSLATATLCGVGVRLKVWGVTSPVSAPSRVTAAPGGTEVTTSSPWVPAATSVNAAAAVSPSATVTVSESGTGV